MGGLSTRHLRAYTRRSGLCLCPSTSEHQPQVVTEGRGHLMPIRVRTTPRCCADRPVFLDAGTGWSSAWLRGGHLQGGVDGRCQRSLCRAITTRARGERAAGRARLPFGAGTVRNAVLMSFSMERRCCRRRHDVMPSDWSSDRGEDLHHLGMTPDHGGDQQYFAAGYIVNSTMSGFSR